MAQPVETVEFDVSDPHAVVARMEGLHTTRDGWVNLRPGIDPEDEPPRPSPLAALFGTQAHPVPMCTWIPGRAGRNGIAPDKVGVIHDHGAKVAGYLARRGVALPDGWKLVQDHPRRGLVAELPPDAEPAGVLEWLMEAASALSAVALTGDWRAEFHLSRQAGAGAR